MQLFTEDLECDTELMVLYEFTRHLCSLGGNQIL